MLSDQGSAVQERAWLRGSVAKVVGRLATCAGGLRILAESIEHIEGRQDLPPLLYTADGDPERIDGEEHRLVAQGGANIRVRALAFRAERPVDEGDGTDEELSPYDRFLALQRQVVASYAGLDELVDRLYDMRDDTDQSLIDKHGLRRDIVGGLPTKISDLRDRILLAMEDEPESLDDPTDEFEALKTIEDAMDGDAPDGTDDEDPDSVYDEAA